MTEMEEVQHPSFRQPTNKDIPIWRYMDLAKYLWMLDRQSLFFARATSLGDPFEASITRPMFRDRVDRAKEATKTDHERAEAIIGHGNFMKRFVQDHLVSCWHMNEHESAAMWKLYSSSSDAVCIRSTYRLLRSRLPQCVFIGEVDYIDYETEEFAGTNIFNYIMHKRLSFAHERELRAVFFHMEGSPDTEVYTSQIEPNGLAMKVDIPSLIEHVFVSPTAAPWFVDLVRTMTTKCGFTLPVSQSSLSAAPLY